MFLPSYHLPLPLSLPGTELLILPWQERMTEYANFTVSSRSLFQLFPSEAVFHLNTESVECYSETLMCNCVTALVRDGEIVCE